MPPALLRTLLVCACLVSADASAAAHFAAPDARTADGGSYYGPLLDSRMHGYGRLEWTNGASYEGSFERGLYSGNGTLRSAAGDVYKGEFRNGVASGRGRYEYKDGTVYTGEFRDDLFNGRGHLKSRDGVYEGAFKAGRQQGKGRFERLDGAIYEGEFADGEFTGTGVYSAKDGTRHEGRFVKWRAEGPGRYIDRWGNVYEGEFADGDLKGRGRFKSKQGVSYEGEFRNYRPHGQGVLRLPNGDVYKGEFADGVFHGKGTLTFAKPQPDGRKQDAGTWRHGALYDEARERQAALNVETALYNQRALLDKALGALLPRDPSKINLYLLAIGGDGSQEVFRREVEFVRSQFARQFYTDGRSIALINSRNTVATVPMATVSSIREALKAIAAQMDREKDILFVFVTSHGSETHELTLAQNDMRLRGLKAKDFAELIAETGVRWKVIAVSACYSGGFIDALKNEHTLIMTAARHDRTSFGCADDSELTYFGRALFKEAMPASNSFTDAFRRAEALIRKWEAADAKGAKEAEGAFSLPQISAPAPVTDYLRKWWAQLPPESVQPRSATLTRP